MSAGFYNVIKDTHLRGEEAYSQVLAQVEGFGRQRNDQSIF